MVKPFWYIPLEPNWYKPIRYTKHTKRGAVHQSLPSSDFRTKTHSKPSGASRWVDLAQAIGSVLDSLLKKASCNARSVPSAAMAQIPQKVKALTVINSQNLQNSNFLRFPITEDGIAAARLYYGHHFCCSTCQTMRAPGGARCADGQKLWVSYQDAEVASVRPSLPVRRKSWPFVQAGAALLQAERSSAATGAALQAPPDGNHGGNISGAFKSE